MHDDGPPEAGAAEAWVGTAMYRGLEATRSAAVGCDDKGAAEGEGEGEGEGEDGGGFVVLAHAATAKHTARGRSFILDVVRGLGGQPQAW
jgi:hypothetical protein